MMENAIQTQYVWLPIQTQPKVTHSSNLLRYDWLLGGYIIGLNLIDAYHDIIRSALLLCLFNPC